MSLQYPDILGALTGGARVNIGVGQFALAIKPNPIPAGRTLDVVLVVQNAGDQAADVSATLKLPEQDAKRQKNRFVARSTHLAVEIKAGEVGCIMLPVAVLTDTAPDDHYRVGVEVTIKPRQKPERIRLAEGGEHFETDMLNPESRAHYDELAGLAFSTSRPPLRSALEVSFAVGQARPAPPPDLHARWISLWTLADAENHLLMARYADVFKQRVFPRLRRMKMYLPLVEATQQRFAEAGYPLQDAEAGLISKMMTLILEYAAPRENAHGFMAAGRYAIVPLLDSIQIDGQPVASLPHWFSEFLRLVALDERVTDHAPRLLTGRLYTALLRDAVEHAFALVQQTTGQRLGEEPEVAAYAEQLAAMIERKRGLNFQRVYLPLVMGGVLVSERMLMPGEQQDDMVSTLVNILTQREAEISPQDADVLELTQQTIHRVTKIYGHRGE